MKKFNWRVLLKYILYGVYYLIEKYISKKEKEWSKGIIAHDLPESLPTSANASPVALSQYSEIFDQVRFTQSRDQGRSNRCGLYTVENQIKDAQYRDGLKPSKQIIDTQLLYSQTDHLNTDVGVIIQDVIDFVKEKGVPILSGREDDTKQGAWTRFNANLSKYIRGLNYVIPWYTGESLDALSYDDAVRLDQTLGDDWVMQVTLNVNGMNYWGNKEPTIKEGSHSWGGHSVAGLRGTFSIKDGKKVMVIAESARYAVEEPYRILSEELFQNGLAFIKFEKIHRGLVTMSPKATDYDALKTKTIRFGDRGEDVVLLQKFLEKEGFFTYSGKKGYYGNLTKIALRNWLISKTGKVYSGRYWGPICRNIIKMV